MSENENGQASILNSNLQDQVVENAGAASEDPNLQPGPTEPVDPPATEPLDESQNEAPAPPPEPAHQYAVGDRVGLLGRVRDIRDKGNIVIEIESSHPGGLFDAPQYVHISEEMLHGGADLIYKTVQERKARG